MKSATRNWRAAPWAAMAIAAAGPAAAQSASASGGWQFEAAIYGWFPAIGGTTAFPPNGGGPSVDVSMGDVIDALKFAFMGSLQARHGAWGLWTDLVYADFGDSKQGSRDFSIGGQRPPVGVSADLGLDLKSWIWTLAGTFSLKSDAEGNTDLLFGTRMLDLSNTLNWSFSAAVPLYPGRSGGGEATLTNWDAVVGLKGRTRLGQGSPWFVPYYADVGGGESKLTWQVQGGIGYEFDWGSVIATWRYLDYEFKSSSKIQTLGMNGPTIGVSFRF